MINAQTQKMIEEIITLGNAIKHGLHLSFFLITTMNKSVCCHTSPFRFPAILLDRAVETSKTLVLNAIMGQLDLHVSQPSVGNKHGWFVEIKVEINVIVTELVTVETHLNNWARARH